MEESHVHDIARVIQLALAPAFLLSGVAALLNVFANRLARIVDRTRVLEVRVEPGGDDPAELEILRRRGELVRWAITLGTGAALFVSLVIGFAFLGFLLKVNFAMGVAGLFVAAMAALTFALGLFLREVTLAVGSLEAFLPAAIRRARRQRPIDEGDGPLGGA
jgi:small-conductance mechanosensitive channel